MKKLLVTILMTMIVALSLAQDKVKTPVEKATAKTNRMEEALDDLSEKQKNDVYELMLTKATEIQKIKEDTNLSDEQKQEKKKAIKKSAKATLRTILTPEQLEKWKSHKKVAKAERKVNKTPEAKADQAILKMNEVVGGLDDEQKAKLKPILIKKIVDVKAIRKNDSLSEDERKAKIKPIRQSSRKQISAILTSEQKKKWKAYKKSNKDKIDQLED